MTKTIITSYTLFLLMAVAVAGVSFAEASEVTGTLSSDTSANTNTSGNISGTVSSASGGGSSSSGGGSSSGSLSNAPTGQVLGASTSNTQTPSFPNAGFAPHEVNTTPSYWSVMITFFKNILSF